MKKYIIGLFLFILGVTADAQIFTPQSSSAGYYDVKTHRVVTITAMKGDSVRRDTIVQTFRTPMYGVWKNDTAFAMIGVSKATNDSIRYILKYRVTDPFGTPVNTSWTTAIAASLNLASTFYYVYTLPGVFVEWQITCYYPGTNGNVTTGKNNRITIYSTEAKSK